MSMESKEVAYLNRVKNKKCVAVLADNAVNLKTNYYCLRIELPAMVTDPVLAKIRPLQKKTLETRT